MYHLLEVRVWDLDEILEWSEWRRGHNSRAAARRRTAARRTTAAAMEEKTPQDLPVK